MEVAFIYVNGGIYIYINIYIFINASYCFIVLQILSPEFVISININRLLWLHLKL